MKKRTSDILLVFAFIVTITAYSLDLWGFWNFLDDTYRFLIFLLIGLSVLGLVLRIGLEANERYVAAGVVTMLFLTGFGLGIASGIFLFRYNANPSDEKIPAASYNGVIRLNGFSNPNIDYKKVALDLIDLEIKYYQKNIKDEDYHSKKGVYVSNLNDRLKDIRNTMTSIEVRKSKGTIDNTLYGSTVHALADEIVLIKKALNPDMEVLLKEKEEQKAKEIERLEKELEELKLA